MHALQSSVGNTSNIKIIFDGCYSHFWLSQLKKTNRFTDSAFTKYPSINPSLYSVAFLSVPSDSFLISMVASCDTPTVSHPLFLPLSQPGCLMSEGLVIYRVTSWWREMQAMGKETLRGQPSRKHRCPLQPFSYFLGMQMRGDSLTCACKQDRCIMYV